jgi:hypothetical protein
MTKILMIKTDWQKSAVKREITSHKAAKHTKELKCFVLS